MEQYTVVERAKEKDAKAFDILYRAYRPKMAGICMNIVKEDSTVVDDLVHDAFILAFVSLGNLRDNDKFSEWLTTIVTWSRGTGCTCCPYPLSVRRRR